MSHGGGDGDGGGERWLVSYSDFITLLMVMFVVLYSMGQVDVEKYKRLAQSMRAAFAGGGAASIIETSINEGGGTSEDGSPQPIVIPGIPQGPTASQEVAGDLTQMLSEQSLGSEVSVQTNVEGILISLSEKLIFTQGTAELQQEAFPVLDAIVTMLKPIDNKVRVVGHTDDSQPIDPRFTSNWDLSLARAMVIANYLIQSGIDPSRLIVSGRGEYEPIFPNDTPEHRALNSRADIVVIYNVDQSVIDTGLDTSSPITP